MTKIYMFKAHPCITLSNKCCHIQCNYTGFKIISQWQMQFFFVTNHMNILDAILSSLQRSKHFSNWFRFNLSWLHFSVFNLNGVHYTDQGSFHQSLLLTIKAWVFIIPKTLTLFMNKICDFPYPIYDLTKYLIPYLWPDS